MIPSSKDRPDLYDGFDGIERPAGWKNPIDLPPEIQKMIDARQGAKKVEPGKDQGKP